MGDRQYALLGDEVSVRTPMLHGDAVAFAAHAVAGYSDGAIVICQCCILHHGHVPQKCVRSFFGLQIKDMTSFQRFQTNMLE